MPKIKDISGQRFSRLVVLEMQGVERHRARWLCRCDCGSAAIVASDKLASGHTRSCGCLQREMTATSHTTHGSSRTLTWWSWVRMHARCNNPKNNRYKWYGGRGIRDRYHSFEAFRADMGERPPGHDLHRKDSDRDYEPGNCEWLPHSEHARLHRQAPNKVRSSAAK
jgi:hypothetical protein